MSVAGYRVSCVRKGVERRGRDGFVGEVVFWWYVMAWKTI